jgi:hypothetical protein
VVSLPADLITSGDFQSPTTTTAGGLVADGFQQAGNDFSYVVA